MRHCFIFLTGDKGENIINETIFEGILFVMERASDLLRRIMLTILIILLALAAVLALTEGLESHSYLFALVMGAAAAALLLRLRGRTGLGRSFDALCARRGSVRCGAVLTALCFALGLVWALVIRIEPFSDYQTYWDCAVSIAYGQEIYSTEYVAMYPHILGYASFLALFIRVFGAHVLVGVLLGLVLSCLSGLLIYAICLETLDLGAAVFAYGLWAFYPGRIMLGSLIFSEPLYTCLVLLFLWLMLRLYARQDRLKNRWLPALAWGLGLGLLLEAINAVRPISAILLIAFVLWLFLLRGREMKDGRLWRLWLTVLVLMILVFQGVGKAWNAHLENILGEEPAGLPVYNLYVGFNMDTLGQWSSEDMDLLFSYRRQPGGSAPAAQRSMLPHVAERLQSGQIDYLQLFGSKLFVFLGNDELGGYTYRFTRSQGFVKICMVVCNCYYYLLLSLALWGLGRLWKLRQRSSFALLPLYMLGLTLAHLLIEVSSRYHYSLIPLFIVFAAFAWGSVKLKDKGEIS